jgi:hypothetical protein
MMRVKFVYKMMTLSLDLDDTSHNAFNGEEGADPLISATRCKSGARSTLTESVQRTERFEVLDFLDRGRVPMHRTPAGDLVFVTYFHGCDREINRNFIHYC